MPVIRISDEVMNMLKIFAEPLVDTPDTVLRKILDDYGKMKEIADHGKSVPFPRANGPLRVSLPRSIPSNMLPSRDRNIEVKLYAKSVERYARWIIAALGNIGGNARAEEVTNHIRKVFGQEFTEWDRETISSGQTRWEKHVHWARFYMARSGLLNGNAPRGVWELTEKGKTFYK